MQRRGLRVRELAASLGLSRSTVYRLVASGQLRAVRLGRRTIVVPADELDRLLGPGPETRETGRERG